MALLKRILFYRDYDQYSGGQQKVLDYFEHCLAHDHWEPEIYWAPGSVPIEETPWQHHANRVAESYNTEKFDVMFIAGMDWAAYLPIRGHQDTPVINLVQHVRHADPEENVHPFLTEPAIRICVSEEVKAAITETGVVRGPTFAIGNGIDQGFLRTFTQVKARASVYILGNKQPAIAAALSENLERHGFTVICHTLHTPRDQVLNAMASCEISVLLPHATEGFYLPALEAMALSDVVIVPDCIGNRSFCHRNVNCLMPTCEVNELIKACLTARDLANDNAASALKAAATRTLKRHTIDEERLSFHAILDKLDDLWPGRRG